MKGQPASHGVTKTHRKMGATGGGGVCTYVCVCVWCVCARVCVRVGACLYLCVCVRACVHLCMCAVCVHLCVFLFYIFNFIGLRIHVFVFVRACVCTQGTIITGLAVHAVYTVHSVHNCCSIYVIECSIATF